MATNVIVQYNDGFLPDILLLTQAPNFVWFDGTTYYNITTTTLLTMYNCLYYNSFFCFVMFGGSAWRSI